MNDAANRVSRLPAEYQITVGLGVEDGPALAKMRNPLDRVAGEGAHRFGVVESSSDRNGVGGVACRRVLWGDRHRDPALCPPGGPPAELRLGDQHDIARWHREGGGQAGHPGADDHTVCAEYFVEGHPPFPLPTSSMRSTARRAGAAMSGGTVISYFMSRSDS